MPRSGGGEAESATARITETIAELDDWRGETLRRVRELIHEADPDVVEEVKWVKPSNPAGVPTWSHGGIICTGEIYRAKVKLTFANGASLEDPNELFNSSLEAGTRRAIDVHEGTELDARAFKALVRRAVDFNTRATVTSKRTTPRDPVRGGGAVAESTRPRSATTRSAPRLLSGGNPQIPKGEGDGPVQDYIAAMPEWKRELGAYLDRLIVRTVPEVHKAVKWNQPFYGCDTEGWFLAFRCYTEYVQLAFFRGASLDPPPPKGSKHPEVRYLDIHESDHLDEGQLVSWIEQASRLPGEKM